MVLEEKLINLVPAELLDEFNDIINDDMRNVLKANCLRRYLEGVLELFFKEGVVSNQIITSKKWDKLNLNGKLNILISNYDKYIGEQLKIVKNLGNKGSHYGNIVTNEQVNEAIKISTRLVEMLLVKYFSKNKFGSEHPLLTMLSILPPKSRVYILEKISEFDSRNLWIVDKLSMAHLKSGQKEKALVYLSEQHKNGLLDDYSLKNYNDKIELLSLHLQKFDISKSILDVKRKYEEFSLPGDQDNYREFTNIMLALLSGYSKVSN